MKVRLWHATVAGGLLGLLLGIVLQVARELYFDHTIRKISEESRRMGVVEYFQMADTLRPQVIPVISCVVGAVLFSLFHFMRSRTNENTHSAGS